MFTLENIEIQIENKADQPYATPFEHLADIMARQRLLVHRAVTRFRRQYSQSKSEIVPGFVAISDEEINALLGSENTQSFTDEVMEQELSVQESLVSIDHYIAGRVAKSIQSGLRLPIVELTRIFGLSAIEIDAIITCLAPEIDQSYERFYGYLQDDMTRRRPSIGLVSSLFFSSHLDSFRIRQIFAYNAPVIKYKLISISTEKGDTCPYLSRSLHIDDRIVSFLLSESGLDFRIHSIIEVTYPKTTVDEEQDSPTIIEQKITAAIESCKGESGLKQRVISYLFGKDQASKRVLAYNVCQTLRIPLLTVDTNRDPSLGLPADEIVFYALREALLVRAVVYISDIEGLIGQEQRNFSMMALIRLLTEMGSIAFLSGERQWSWPVPHDDFLFLPFELCRADYNQQMTWWRKGLRSCGELPEKTITMLLSKYPLTPELIDNAVILANTSASLRGEPVSADDLDQACRMQNIPDLGGYAIRIIPGHTWEDLVLPDAQLKQLHDICNQVTYKAVVYGKWGFGKKLSLGRGLHALFSGPPGTGKTMAAEVLANKLHLDLYKIDLSQIVSKYIGETEKNLNTIFSQAQKGQAILLFDEADALLGKRSEVRDAHDRYANLEIAYLLQKMEEYEGISILTTNLRQNMDDAFTRRIRFIVEFPFPEEEHRHRLWKSIWPHETPLNNDIDFADLAKKFKLAGGNIRNIALAAAFYASANGNRVEMKHLLAATKEEFKKMGRLIDESEYIPVVS